MTMFGFNPNPGGWGHVQKVFFYNKNLMEF
jgi:hypothetical protein